MKNLVKISILLSIVALSASATAPSKVVVDDRYTQAIILQDGVEKKVKVLKSSKNTRAAQTDSTQKMDSKDGLIVKFEDLQNFSLEDFEKKYSVKLEAKMIIGYYIFSNQSAKSDLELVEQIIKNETNVQTIKPNWKMQKTIY